MDPSLDHLNLDPPPPQRRELLRWLVPAAVLHVPLLLALAWGVDWSLDSDREERVAQAPAAEVDVEDGSDEPAAESPLRRWFANAGQALRQVVASRDDGDEAGAAERATATAGAGPAPTPVAGRPAAAPPGREAAGVAQAVQQPSQACPIRPFLSAGSARDGGLFPPAEVADRAPAEIAASLLAGKEAAAAGLRRDAEVAFLTACRIADAVRGPASADAAEARYQLARHYASVATASDVAPPQERAGLLQRAQAYYQDSLPALRAHHGAEHEKTRFAAEGLASVRQHIAQLGGGPAVAQGPPAAVQAPATSPRQAAAAPQPPARAAERPQPPGAVARAEPSVAAPRPRQEEARAPQRPAPPAQPREEVAVETVQPPGQATGSAYSMGAAAATAPPRPSFDCRRARSVPERLICADAELSQLDRDLGRLHARAKAAAPDAAAFRRQNDAEWRRREASCRDRDCLLRWYAERRQQLLQSVGEGERSERAAAR